MVKPLFAFGEGLSYSTFEYTSLKAETTQEATCTVSFKVRNTSNLKGSTSCLVYLSPKDPSVARPVKELAAFAKIELEAGASQTVTVQIPRSGFSYWDEEGKTWIAEAGSYDVLVDDEKVTVELQETVKWTTTPTNSNLYLNAAVDCRALLLCSVSAAILSQ